MAEYESDTMSSLIEVSSLSKVYASVGEQIGGGVRDANSSLRRVHFLHCWGRADAARPRR